MRTDFIHFVDIDVNNPASWAGKKILSFDIDWAEDEILNYTIDIVERYKIKCCFFVTHHTPVLERLKSNPLIELGLHPNFNPLLNRDSLLSAEEIILQLKALLPLATVIRSHSLTTSGSWIGLYQRLGIKYTSNYMMNGVENIQPFYHVNGLIEVPIYYADDGHVFLNDHSEIPRLIDSPSLNVPDVSIKVFNFHPVHVFLNSVSFEDYVYYKEHKAKKPGRKDYTGSFNVLISLLEK